MLRGPSPQRAGSIRSRGATPNTTPAATLPPRSAPPSLPSRQPSPGGLSLGAKGGRATTP